MNTIIWKALDKVLSHPLLSSPSTFLILFSTFSSLFEIGVTFLLPTFIAVDLTSSVCSLSLSYLDIVQIVQIYVGLVLVVGLPHVGDGVDEGEVDIRGR